MAELRNWQPGYLDRFKYGIAGLIGDDRQAVRNAEKITGLLEYAPGIGDAMAGAEAVDAFNEGNYGTAGVLGAATVAGLVPGVGDAAAQGIKKGIRAYHGSPHDFDKFSIDKIGTGEGAQAYGHGLYFAEQEDVAKQYRDQLANGWRLEIRDPLRGAGIEGRDLDSASQMLSISSSGEAAARDWENWTGKALTPEQKAAFDEAYKRKGGRMYEVNINADPDDFLDWDKPLSEQSDAAKRALAKATAPNMSEADALARLERYAQDKAPLGAQLKNLGFTNEGNIRAETANQLKQQGIPGIKYLDAGSRDAGDGSRNYVVFDDALIEILRKYGIAGLGLLGAGGATYNAQNDGPAPLL